MNEEPQENAQYQPSFGLKLLVAYLYFIQGIILSIPSSIVLVYTHLPSASILSLFSATSLSFSFKFITAPVIEKFSSLKYGKRKTWMMIGQFMSFLMIFIGSFLTGQNQQISLAILLILAIFFITVQDISVDGLAIKQLKVPHLVAMLQGVAQTLGIVIGGLVLIKATSQQFASSVGLSHPITTAPVMLRIFAVMIVVPLILIHFRYEETLLESEKRANKQTTCKIICYYKAFFQRKTKYCRTFLFFLVYLQGFNLFDAYYEFQLIKNYNFSKNTINTILNAITIPISIIAVLVTPKFNKIGWVKCLMCLLITKWIINLVTLIVFPSNVPAVSVIYFFTTLIETLRFILTSILINQFPVMGLSGMFITMLNSAANFGRVKALDIYLTGLWGWRISAIIGLSLQVFLLMIIPKLYSYLQRGSTDLGELTDPTQVVQEKKQTPMLEMSVTPYQKYVEEIEENKNNDDEI